MCDKVSLHTHTIIECIIALLTDKVYVVLLQLCTIGLKIAIISLVVTNAPVHFGAAKQKQKSVGILECP